MFDLRKIFFPKSGKNRDFLAILEQFLGFFQSFFQLSTIQFILLKENVTLFLNQLKSWIDYLNKKYLNTLLGNLLSIVKKFLEPAMFCHLVVLI
jgi:hypothetical protein